MEFLGYDVKRLNHVGDWGTQFGMLIHYLKVNHPAELVESSEESSTASSATKLALTVSDLMGCYKEAKKCFDSDPNFKEAAKLEVVKLQGGNKDSLRIWSAICDKSRLEFQKIYNILNVTIEERGESFYNPFLEPLVEKLKADGVAVESQGSLCVFIPPGSAREKYVTKEGDPLPLIVQKADGVS